MTRPTPADQPQYRPDIDGLRAVAVVSVVAYHAGLTWLSGGFAGVDIFFVISGYLITSLILKESHRGQFSLKHFYIRRARRLFPALFAVLATSAVLAWWLLMPSEMEDFGESLATAAAFSSNLMFWSEAGYFDGPSEFKPLLHTWSLAIEEQYYLLFPLLLMAAKRSGRYLLVFGLVALVSLAISQWYVERAPAAAFFLLPHRLWELMIGSLLATVVVTRPEWLARLPDSIRLLMALFGLSSLAFCLFQFTPSTAFPGVNALWPTLGTAAIICAGTGGTSSINRALSARALVAVGLISYSLYLWHWPVLVFTKLYLINPPTEVQTGLAVGLSILLAWLSWRFIERPFRASLPQLATKPTVEREPQRLLRLSDQRVLPLSLLCIAILIGIGVLLDKTDGLPNRLPEHIAALADVANDKPPERKRCTGVAAADVSLERLCKIGQAQSAPEFIVWGDSHAMTLIPQFEDLANQQQTAGLNATSNGCAALLGTWRPADDPDRTCAAFNDKVFELIQNTPSIKRIVLSGRWAVYAEGTRYKHESGNDLLLVDDQSSKPYNHSDLAQNNAVFHRALSRTLTGLAELGKEIVLIGSIPEIGWDTPNVIARAQLLNRPLTIAPTPFEHRQRQANVVAAIDQLIEQATPNVLQLDPAELLCNPLECSAVLDGQPLYVDEDHLSSKGSRLLKPLLKKAIDKKRG